MTYQQISLSDAAQIIGGITNQTSTAACAAANAKVASDIARRVVAATLQQAQLDQLYACGITNLYVGPDKNGKPQ